MFINKVTYAGSLFIQSSLFIDFYAPILDFATVFNVFIIALIKSVKYTSTFPYNFNGVVNGTSSIPTHVIIFFANGLSPSFTNSNLSIA